MAALDWSELGSRSQRHGALKQGLISPQHQLPQVSDVTRGSSPRHHQLSSSSRDTQHTPTSTPLIQDRIVRPLLSHEVAAAAPSNMTEASPDAGDTESRQKPEAESTPGAEAAPLSHGDADATSSSGAEGRPIAPAGESSRDGGNADTKATADANGDSDSASDDDDDDDGGGDNDGATEQDDSDDEDEEPKLKYARLTQHLGAVYRNGDATSSFLVAGDKMIIGTHSGNIVSGLDGNGSALPLTCNAARHPAPYIPVSPCLPRPLGLCHRHLHLSLPTAAALLQSRDGRPRGCSVGKQPRTTSIRQG